MIESEAKSNKKRATALNNPITGSCPEFDDYGKQDQSSFNQSKFKARIELEDDMDHFSSVNVKSSALFPDIPAIGIDKR